MKSDTTKFIRVDEWKPGPNDCVVGFDGKLVIIPFDKLFKKDKIKTFNSFVIKKESYVNKLERIVHYINYFVKFYDTNQELLLAYLKLKYMVDNKKAKINQRTFIKIMYSILFTDSIKAKITQMVDDNFYIDPGAGKKPGAVYNEALEFTAAHAKVMLKISISMKLMVPILFHFINASNNGDKTLRLYSFYENLFHGMYDPEINIYNKLWITAMAKINVNFIVHRPSWEQREIVGMDPLLYLDSLLKDKLISETMFKYNFNNNIISFNSVVLDKQLGFFLSEDYKQNRVELTSKKDPDSGLSGLDKLEMNLTKIDESASVMSDLNIKSTIKKIKKKMNICIPKEEIEFYIDNHKMHKFQTQLVFYYYAKYFNGYRDLNLLTRKQYMKLLVLLKRRLQIQGNVYLPQILSGNIENRINTRTIQNTKFLTKIENSSVYQSLIADKFSTLNDLNKSNVIINLLSTILNTSFTIADYDNLDKTGEVLEINPDILSDEFLNFLNQI